MDAHTRRGVPSVFPRRLAGEGEAADPDALRFEDDDGAGRELVGDGGEVAEEERCLLLRPPFGASTEQDNRRAILRAARSVAKSVSAETRTRASAAARSKISSSAAAWRP